MPSKVYVIGVGMTKFEKPGSRENFDYPDMARESGTKALKDAGISYDKVEQAFVGYVYGDSTSGQRAVYELGLTGIPIVNVNNNCSTGSTALYLAKNVIEAGLANCVLALGFEKMQKGSLSSTYSDRCNPVEKHVELMSNIHELTSAPMMAQMFGNAGRDYQKKYNVNDEVFAMIAHKNHKHSVNNPYAQFNKEYSLDEIKNSPMIHQPLTKLQCSPTSDGSAAAILASEEFVKKHGLESKAVEIMAIEMATDLKSSFSKDTDCMKIVGYDMSKLAAEKAFKKASIRPTDVQVVELHDCFSANELITYEAIGLCEQGKAASLVLNKDNTYGGKYVINPSGGLISKGHPLGATGIAQCAELCWQLRGHADKRQVKNVKYALQHNIGLGGAAIVAVYKLGFPNAALPAAKATTVSTGDSSDLKSATAKLKSGKFFEELESKLKQDSSFVTKINAIIEFCITLDGSNSLSFIVDVKNAPGSVTVSNGNTKSDCKITIADEDLLNIMNGKSNMMSAFTQKKIKISGNMSIAMKLNQLFTALLKTQSSAPSAETKPSSNSSGLTSATTKLKSGKFFEELESKLKQDSSFVTKINAIIEFCITLDGSNSLSFLVDVKNAPGSVTVNTGNAKSDCKITIADEDLLNIMAGKSNMMSAFTQKKIKISGNMSIAMKLNQLFTALLKTQSKL